MGGFFGAKASRLRDVISGAPRKIRGIILVVITSVIVIFQNFAGRNLINNMYAEYFYDGAAYDSLVGSALFVGDTEAFVPQSAAHYSFCIAIDAGDLCHTPAGK